VFDVPASYDLLFERLGIAILLAAGATFFLVSIPVTARKLIKLKDPITLAEVVTHFEG